MPIFQILIDHLRFFGTQIFRLAILVHDGNISKRMLLDLTELDVFLFLDFMLEFFRKP